MGAIPSLSWNGHRSLLLRVLELINMYVLLLPTETPSNNIREHEIADVTKKARIYTILSEIFTLCLCF
jgi:hypothetical protein